MNRRMFARLSALTVAGGLAAAACAPPAQPAAAPVQPIAVPATAKIRAVATFSVIADLAQNVAGDKAEIAVLVGPGGDTHDFEPTPSDAAKLADAHVILENGLEFETWLDGLYQSSGSKAARVVTSEGITARTAGEEHGHVEFDPHVWQDAKNAMQMVGNIRDGLSKADPANAATFAANADAYLANLAALDAEVVGILEQLLKDQRKLVTSHDALGYFADRYGFEVLGSVIASLNTAAGEPSAQDIVTLVDDIRSQGVKAIFLESIANPALVERVASEAGVKVGPELYTDALGAAGSPGATYIEAMRHNARAIVAALK